MAALEIHRLYPIRSEAAGVEIAAAAMADLVGEHPPPFEQERVRERERRRRMAGREASH